MKYWKNKTLTMCVMNAILFGGSTLLASPAVQAAEQTADKTVTAGNNASDPYTAITVTSGKVETESGKTITLDTTADNEYVWNGVYTTDAATLYLGGAKPTLTVGGKYSGDDAAITAVAYGIRNTATLTVQNTGTDTITLTDEAAGGTYSGSGKSDRSAIACGIRNSGTALTVDSPLTVTATAVGGTAASTDSTSVASAWAFGAYNEKSTGSLTLGKAGTTSSFTVTATGGTAGVGNAQTVDAATRAAGLWEVTTVNGDLTIAASAVGGTYLGTGKSQLAAPVEAYGIENRDNATTINGSVNLTSVKAIASVTNTMAEAAAYGVNAHNKLIIHGDFKANVTAAAAAGNSAHVSAYGADASGMVVDGNVTLNVTADGGTAAANAVTNATAYAYGVHLGDITLGKAGGTNTHSITVTAKGGIAGTEGDVNKESATANAFGLERVTTVNGNLDLTVCAIGGTALGTAANNDVSASAYGLVSVGTVNGDLTMEVSAVDGKGGAGDGDVSASAYGITDDNGGTTTINGSVNLKSVKATASAMQNAEAEGISVNHDLTITGNLIANVAAEGAGSSDENSTQAIGIGNSGGTTKVGGDVTLTTAVSNTGTNPKLAAAIETSGTAATYINTTDGTSSLGKTVKLTGDVVAYDSGTNDIILDGSGSWLQGNIVAVDGTNNIIIENGAVWQPVFDDRNGTFWYDSAKYTTTQDYVAALTLKDSGVIDLTWDNATRAADWRTLTIDSLSGDGGILCINADLANGNADQLSLGASSSTTNLNIDVEYDPYFNTKGLTNDSTLTGKALVVSGAGAANVTTVTGVKDTYNLYDYVPEFTKDTDNQWYLTSYKITNMQPEIASGAVRTAEQDRAGMNSFWLKEANSLSRRMGELRAAEPAEAGAWARWNKGEAEQGESKVDYNLGQVGYDRVLTGSHERTYRGGAVSYATGSGHYELGSGDLKESTLSFYQTGIRQNGSYYDVILKAGKFMDDVNLTQTANPSHGDYSSWAYSVSGEYGRRYGLGGGSYVEPQAELLIGRIQGADYTTSTGLHVDLGAQNKALTRLGAALGRDFGGSSLYFKASWYHDFGSGITMTGSDSSLSRSYSQDIARDWAELVLGGTVRAGQNCMVYGECSKYFGEIKSNLQFNLGARLSF